MSATKLPTIIGLAGIVEASYNAGGAISSSTDGILLAAPATPTLEYLHDGAHQPPPGMAGYNRRVAPSGRGCSVPFQIEAKGAAAAYSASQKANIDRLLKMAGFDETLVTTGGSESSSYAPTAGGAGAAFKSGAFNCYARQQLFPITGAYADLEIVADGPVVPLWTFNTRGLVGAISDAAVPDITYPDLTTDPPKAVNIQFTLGNFTGAKVRRFSFRLGRQITPRANQNAASGHAGYTPSRRTPTLEVAIEATSLQATPFHAAAAIDPYNLFDAASNLACSLQVGSTQYNRWKLTAGAAQLMAPPQEEDAEDGALWVCQFQLNPSSINLNDDVTFLFN